MGRQGTGVNTIGEWASTEGYFLTSSLRRSTCYERLTNPSRRCQFVSDNIHLSKSPSYSIHTYSRYKPTTPLQIIGRAFLHTHIFMYIIYILPTKPNLGSVPQVATIPSQLK